jgi:hypothetical protein
MIDYVRDPFARKLVSRKSFPPVHKNLKTHSDSIAYYVRGLFSEKFASFPDVYGHPNEAFVKVVTFELLHPIRYTHVAQSIVSIQARNMCKV